jgi:hypothetical protein
VVPVHRPLAVMCVSSLAVVGRGLGVGGECGGWIAYANGGATVARRRNHGLDVLRG